MANPISSKSAAHVHLPRALDAAKGKAAEAPAHVARAQGVPEDSNFGKVVSEIAKSRKTTPTADPSTTA